jgi:hypothetical protein
VPAARAVSAQAFLCSPAAVAPLADLPEATNPAAFLFIARTVDPAAVAEILPARAVVAAMVLATVNPAAAAAHRSTGTTRGAAATASKDLSGSFSIPDFMAAQRVQILDDSGAVVNVVLLDLEQFDLADLSLADGQTARLETPENVS